MEELDINISDIIKEEVLEVNNKVRKIKDDIPTYDNLDNNIDDKNIDINKLNTNINNNLNKTNIEIINKNINKNKNKIKNLNNMNDVHSSHNKIKKNKKIKLNILYQKI